MQLAVAAYACPRMDSAPSASASGNPVEECDGNAPAPGLCQAHCQQGNQSVEKPQSPGVPPLPATGLSSPFPATDVATPFLHLAPPFLARTTAPPLAIRNCCFRI